MACSGGDWLGLLVTIHFALCSLACRPFGDEEGVAALVVVSGSGMHSNGFAGIFAPRAMFPTIAGVPQIQEQIVEVVLHSTGAGSAASCDRSCCACTTDHGDIGGDSACAFHHGAVVAFRATDYGENVEVIQLVHFHCGADRGRANATDHEDLRC